MIKDTSVYREDLVVSEIIYNPKETKMMQDARKAGVQKIVGGKGMLLWQGVEAFKLFTGQDMPVEEVIRLTERLLTQYATARNITVRAVK